MCDPENLICLTNVITPLPAQARYTSMALARLEGLCFSMVAHKQAQAWIHNNDMTYNRMRGEGTIVVWQGTKQKGQV